jgi:hypothetical protein
MALPQKFPRCRSRSGDGADPLELDPIGIKSYPAITVLSPGLGYGIFLCHLAVPVLRCHCITSLASFSSGYANMLRKLY